MLASARAHLVRREVVGRLWGNGFDEALIERNKLDPLCLVDEHIGEVHKAAPVVIDHLEHAFSRGWDKEVAYVFASSSPDQDPDFSSLNHGALLLSAQ